MGFELFCQEDDMWYYKQIFLGWGGRVLSFDFGRARMVYDILECFISKVLNCVHH